MKTHGTNINVLAEGMEVVVNPQSDRTRNERVRGRISEILTRSGSHPHGILVRLENGEVGRVKEVSDETLQTVTKNIIVENANHSPISLDKLIAGGENHFVEFKSSSLWSEWISQDIIDSSKSWELKQFGRAASKIIIAKTIAGFLNTDGGCLLIGIKENKDSQKDVIIGIESEFRKLKDPCVDGYRRMIIDSIIKPYFPSVVLNHFNNYLSIEFQEFEGLTICKINIAKSEHKVFINVINQDYFYIRVDATTRQLTGEEIVDYCMRRFG